MPPRCTPPPAGLFDARHHPSACLQYLTIHVPPCLLFVSQCARASLRVCKCACICKSNVYVRHTHTHKRTLHIRIYPVVGIFQCVGDHTKYVPGNAGNPVPFFISQLSASPLHCRLIHHLLLSRARASCPARMPGAYHPPVTGHQARQGRTTWRCLPDRMLLPQKLWAARSAKPSASITLTRYKGRSLTGYSDGLRGNP